ncbi:MAG: ribulose-phosphate 3-epimerase [Candidatus Babeliales bacterium]
MSKKAQIFPSLMSADLMNLENVIKSLEPHCDGFHIDIMDNHFVPNITWGADITNQIAKICKKPLLVHLMVEKPKDIIMKLKLTPDSVISFHLEAVENPQEIINVITTAGYTPSIAIKPGTQIEALCQWLVKGIPHVLLMSVEPGFSGQTFLPESNARLKELTAYRTKHKKEFIICMDGGINQDNIGNLHRLGAEQFAVSSALFGAKEPLKALKELYDCSFV